MGGLDLLPALGRAADVLFCLVVRSCVACRIRPPGTVRPPRSGVSPFPGPADESRTGLRAPRDSAPPPTGMNRKVVPGDLSVTQAHREREQAQARWAQQPT